MFYEVAGQPNPRSLLVQVVLSASSELLHSSMGAESISTEHEHPQIRLACSLVPLRKLRYQ